MRQGASTLHTRNTLPCRDMNATSMAWRMPKVCTAAQGINKMPDRGPGGLRPSKPRARPHQLVTLSSLSLPRGAAGRPLFIARSAAIAP